jgi:integrase
MGQKITSKYPGVRYREHATDKLRNGTSDKCYFIRYRADGKLHEESVGWARDGWSAEKAHAILAEIKTNIRTGSGPQSLAQKRALAKAAEQAAGAKRVRESVRQMSLGEFVNDHFIPYIKKRKATWDTDKMRIDKAVLPRLGMYPLSAITTKDVQDLLDAVAATGAAPATVGQYLAVVRRIFNVAAQIVINGVQVFTGRNPVIDVVAPEVHNERERYLTHAEAATLIDAAGKLRLPDLRHAIILGLNTGLRMGEMVRLRWHNVDFPGAIVTVPYEPRRKPGGHVPLNRDALTVFAERLVLLQNGPSGLIFPPIGDGSKRNFSHIFKQVTDSIHLNDGITDSKQKIVFHSLRHTFASWLALSGTDIYRINKLMRHKTLAMTMRYAHLIPDATRAAVHSLRPPDP